MSSSGNVLKRRCDLEEEYGNAKQQRTEPSGKQGAMAEPERQPKLAMKEKETDARRLSQRRKEISYGKNTLGYDRYVSMVPKAARKRGDPQTPDAEMKASKRQFDGIVRAWRRRLHEWDPPTEAADLENPLLVKESPPPEQNTHAHPEPVAGSCDDDFGPAPLALPPPAKAPDDTPPLTSAQPSSPVHHHAADDDDSDDDLL